MRKTMVFVFKMEDLAMEKSTVKRCRADSPVREETSPGCRPRSSSCPPEPLDRKRAKIDVTEELEFGIYFGSEIS